MIGMRTPVPKSDVFPFHVSARTPNRELFRVSMKDAWSIMEDYLFLTQTTYGLKIHAFVLMLNHFHMLVSTPRLNLGSAMNFFLRETSKEQNRLSGRINQNWGGPYHKTLVNSYQYYMNVYKYIYRNPVRARFCDRVEEYPFSTINGLCGKSKLIIPLEEDTLLFDPEFNVKTFRWLNTPSCPKDEAEIKRALRRSVFELPLDREKRLQSHLETKLI